MKVLIIAAALCGLALSILGAVGAHLVGSAEAGGWHEFNATAWNSAMLYGFAHTLAVLLVVALPIRGKIAALAGWAFLLGTILFSFAIMAKEILLTSFVPTADPTSAMQLFDRITVVTPVGGIAFMVGWILLAAAALMQRRDS